MFKIITKENGKFGLQRVGGTGVFGSFDTWAEACLAAAQAANADATRHE